MRTTDGWHLTAAQVQGSTTHGTSFFSSSPVLFSSGHAAGSGGKGSVTHGQIRLARQADLADFLLQRHPEMFRVSGNSLYMLSRDSLYIRAGFPGFTDFSSGRHGNPIDFLTGYLGYSFVDAVMALIEGAACVCPLPAAQHETLKAKSRPIALPERADRPYRRVYAYLRGRGIPHETIRSLEEKELLYQDKSHGNAVFINPEQDYCELRGTLTYAQKPFHGCRKSKPDRFWYLLSTDKRPETAYLCESAIDAVSLLQLHRNAGSKEPAVYISIGGVSNQKTIERIKYRMPSILAVDNDMAGYLCRERNSDMSAIIPVAKDWNEDLQLLNI